MSNRSRVDPVTSGTCYVVTSVNDRLPASLEDFVACRVAAVTVASPRQVVTIRGSVRIDGNSVLVYEKDSDGTGKDVRTWRIKLQNGRFEAFERSLY